MQQFQVGPGRGFANGMAYAQAATAKQVNGDLSMWQDVSVTVDPGTYAKPFTYENDCWWLPRFVNNFTLDGSGGSGAKARIINKLAKGMPSIPGLPFSGRAADKGLFWYIGRNTIIKGFEVEGAKTSSGANNGGGVRMDEGVNLTLEKMVFRYSQNGALLMPVKLNSDQADISGLRGSVVLRTCEFSQCGFGGQSHLLYCGTVESLLAEDSVFTNAVGEGNTFKTRADSTTLRNSTLTTGSGYNSQVYDSMGGRNLLRNNTFQNLTGYSSQPKRCVFIYIEPQSKEVEIDIQYNVFDLRGKVIGGKPVLVDPRVLYNGTGGIGEDGKWHKPGENYYLPADGSMGEAMRDMVGIVDNNIILINADQRQHFGYDPETGQNRMIWTPNDVRYGPIPLPPGLVEGPNNKFIVAEDTRSGGDDDDENCICDEQMG